MWLLFPLLIIFTLAGCRPAEAVMEENQTEVEAAQPEPEAEEPAVEEPEPVNIKVDSLISSSLKAVLTQAARQAFDSFEMVDGQSGYDLAVTLGPDSSIDSISIVMVPVVDFFTVTDEISFDQIKGFWEQGSSPEMELVITEQNLELMETVMGPVQSDQVTVAEGDLSQALMEGNRFSIVPFEDLRTEYKVLEVDGVSVLDKDASMQDYPLCFGLNLEGDEQYIGQLSKVLQTFELTNRQTENMITINMTGVTALVRGTANRMEQNGILYPAEEIRDTLIEADITHISNEIPFVEGCTGASDSSLVFCSRPEYFELLQHVGTDIVELTGNHMNDYGHQWMDYTLDIYDEAGLPYFGGGRELEDSYQPVLFEIGGNKIAFLGCNFWGPAYDWATKDSPGSTPPNYEDLEEIVSQLESQGYNVVFTFQYVETYNYYPTQQQVIDFGRMIDAGASIVSGSQSHHPMGVEFKPEGFINYGLGNLFFDQMRSLGMRQGIIARHIFYENRHISTELITTMLEDYSQPRLTTPEEREELLQAIFEGSIKQ
ncbi:MAG: CapA family protein [Actinomycetia bacterium]|nr:CapA family protein [Actinomycetes bacterium]